MENSRGSQVLYARGPIGNFQLVELIQHDRILCQKLVAVPPILDQRFISER